MLAETVERYGYDFEKFLKMAFRKWDDFDEVEEDLTFEDKAKLRACALMYAQLTIDLKPDDNPETRSEKAFTIQKAVLSVFVNAITEYLDSKNKDSIRTYLEALKAETEEESENE